MSIIKTCPKNNSGHVFVFVVLYMTKKGMKSMENNQENFEALKKFNVNYTYKFVLNTKETLIFDVNPQVIYNLCGFNFTAKSHTEGKVKLEKRREKTYDSQMLYKFSLIEKTRHFSGAKLFFVVFDPEFKDGYVDLIFRQGKHFIALKTDLTIDPFNYELINSVLYRDRINQNETYLSLQDVYEVKDFDDLLCGKTVAYPIHCYSDEFWGKYDKKYVEFLARKAKQFSNAYGAKLDVSKDERIKNAKKTKAKVLMPKR